MNNAAENKSTIDRFDGSAVVACATHATKRYGRDVALDDVTFAVPAGITTGLLGPNGAGKSTLLNLLIGVRRPDSGRVDLFGRSPTDAASRLSLGVTPQETGLPQTLRVGEVVNFVGRHYPDPVPPDELLDRFGLGGLRRRQTGGLSGGQKRRLAVALAFVGRPALVVLDEPTTGLDVEGRRALWTALREFRDNGGTVLLTSHYLEEVDQLAERVAVLGAGRVLADGDVTTIRGMVGFSEVSLRAGHVPELPEITLVQRAGDRYDLHTTDADALVRALVRNDVAFRDLRVQRASLEDAFLALTDPDHAPTRPDHDLTPSAGGLK